MVDTFWDGKHKAAIDALHADIQALSDVDTGAIPKNVKRPALEAWRRMQNGYYDLYNNGGMNWDIRGPGFRSACKFAGRRAPVKGEIIRFTSHGSVDEVGAVRLEYVADAVFLLALVEKVGGTQ